MSVKDLGATLGAFAVLFSGMTARADPGSRSQPSPTKDQCVDANEAAQTLRVSEKLRGAMDKLAVCLAQSCPAVVRDDCAQRLNDLQKALPTIVFDVQSAGGTDLTNVRVKMDGAPLLVKLDGSSIAVDPGQHTFTFEADGFSSKDEALLVREGVKARHERVVLQGLGEPPPGLEATGGHRSAIRIASFVALGVGVVGVAVGSIGGLSALGDQSSLHGLCKQNGACPASERADIDGLQSNPVIADVGFSIGAVGLAAATVLFIVSRSHKPAASEAATVSFGIGRAGVAGTF